MTIYYQFYALLEQHFKELWTREYISAELARACNMSFMLDLCWCTDFMSAVERQMTRDKAC